MSADGQKRYMILSLLEGFYWFDEGLQSYLQARGWPGVTRPQSMVMANVVDGVRRPSDIARRLGVSRQAIHVTLNQMIELGMLALVDDPSNGRVKIVTLTPLGEAMRGDALAAMVALNAELGRRLGASNLELVERALGKDWGEPMTFTPEQVGHHD